jgi:hypothetical protein
MNSTELDTAYTALAETIGRVEKLGEGNAQLMLATLALSLIAKLENADAALALISQTEKLTINPT